MAKLSSFPKARVSILRDDSTHEVQDFSDDFVEVFKRLQWTIESDATSLEPMTGTGLGVFVKSQEEHPLAAGVLVQALHDMLFEVHPQTAKPNELRLEADEIRFVIAAAR